MTDSDPTDQPGLFPEDVLEPPKRVGASRRRAAPPQVFEDTQALEPLSRRIPASLRFGTSSWSFPGWQNIVWDAEYTNARLARDGLPAYACHPLLRCVGLDRTFYAPMTAPSLRELCEGVPPEFRFVVKAWQNVTSRTVRRGRNDWRPSPDFLSTQAARERIIVPALEGLGEHLGAIVFQFPPLDRAVVRAVDRFAHKLGQFLNDLPIGPDYVVELRNPEFYCNSVRDAIVANGARPCLTVHPGAVSLTEQYDYVKELGDGHTVVRWMLPHGMKYEQARNQFSPFDRLQAADISTRRDVAQICASELALGNDVSVVVNNKAEGCAPASIEALAVEVAGQLPPATS